MSGLLKAVADNPTQAGGSLLIFSFCMAFCTRWGRAWQIVITTWLATHPSKLKSSIGLTLASSLLGIVAIVLVVVVLSLLQLPARQLHMSSFWLEKGSYALVGVLGLILCWRALKKLRACCKNQNSKRSRRITFTMPTADAGISICRRRNSCKTATTGAHG
jgi:ABC-type nickel/cobalt efflux system permease component RcnA